MMVSLGGSSDILVVADTDGPFDIALSSSSISFKN
jgi:hypothetical protein